MSRTSWPSSISSRAQGAAAGLHANHTGRQVREKLQHSAARQLLLQHRLAALVGTMHLERALGDVETDGGSLHLASPLRGSLRFHAGRSRPSAGGVHPTIKVHLPTSTPDQSILHLVLGRLLRLII